MLQILQLPVAFIENPLWFLSEENKTHSINLMTKWKESLSKNIVDFFYDY